MSAVMAVCLAIEVSSKVAKSADNTKSFVGCDALILDGHSVSNTWPMNKIQNKNADVTHEATVGKIMMRRSTTL